MMQELDAMYVKQAREIAYASPAVQHREAWHRGRLVSPAPVTRPLWGAQGGSAAPARRQPGLVYPI